MSATVESYVIFELAGNAYGLPSLNVQHIELFEHVTLVPNANPAIDGVVFSRGQVFPALNLRVRFGLPRTEKSMRTRIIFSTIHGRTVGLIVDAAREFRSISTDAIRPIEETLAGINRNYLKAVATVSDRLVLMLDLEAILNVDDVTVPEQNPVAPVENANVQ